MKRKLIALSLTLAMICSIGASTISVQGADSPAEGDAATNTEEIFSANREQSVTVESDGMDETADDTPQVTEPAPPSTGDEPMKGEDGGPNVGEETGDPDEGADEVDKSELDWLINQFVESDFTEESWQEFKPVYDAAVALLANPDATAEQVQQMIQDVQDKSEVLVYTEEAATDQIYKALKQLIDFYEPIFIQSDYTEDTWANYAKALDAAKEVYNKPGEIYDVVWEAGYLLDEAAHQLVVKNPVAPPQYLADALSYAQKLSESDAFNNLKEYEQDAFRENLWLFNLLSQAPSQTRVQKDSLWFNTIVIVYDTKLVNTNADFLALIAKDADKINMIKADKKKIRALAEEANKLGVDATPNEIEEMIYTLIDAIAQTSVAADTSKLQEAMDRANAVDVSLYTEASLAELNKAKQAAQELLDDEYLYDGYQKEVDDAAATLLDAIGSLILKEETKPEETPTPEDPKKEETPETPKNDSEKSDTPKTSDAGTLPLAAAGFAALALGGILWTKRRDIED